jgi:hypothetical protein
MVGSSKRRCIFCDEPIRLTKEHLWSKWTRRLVRYDTLKHEYEHRVFNVAGVARTVKTISGDARNRGLKTVCKKCNGGWMSAIEEWAKPRLAPLIKGDAAFLNRDDQIALATWIAMKTMVAEYFDPTEAAITLSERQFLRDRRRVPTPNWQIWIGNYERTSWAGQWVHGSMSIAPSVRTEGRDPRVPNTQTTTFVVGKLYANVFSSEILGLIRGVSLGPRAIGKVARIWPVQEEFITWPPNALNDADANAIASAIFVSLKSQFPPSP